MGEWIKLGKGVPSIGEIVLGWNNSKGFYITVRKESLSGSGEIYWWDDEPSHWQPLPPPPTSNQQPEKGE